jgi:hypothetical protein
VFRYFSVIGGRKMATGSSGYIQIRFVSGDSIFLREDPAIRSGQQDWLQHDQDS